jgi:hypothetical protein
MVKGVLELLNKSVEHIPEEKHEEAKGRILTAFARAMFYAPFNGVEEENK